MSSKLNERGKKKAENIFGERREEEVEGGWLETIGQKIKRACVGGELRIPCLMFTESCVIECTTKKKLVTQK